MANEESRKKITNRLRTLKGHIAGIEKMVEEGKECEDILIQIAAVKSSMHKIGMIIVEEHALDCLLNQEDDECIDKEKAKKVIKTLLNYTK
ncbi:metal-sensitive transcriptional regulator [Wukongibacter baidiensis]|uniref:metal-sensitive transcriptional regulator n=1 Tax=Wukongibacter baidiensis TaxID=1723361 RepID=UPI003D7FB74A